MKKILMVIYISIMLCAFFGCYSPRPQQIKPIKVTTEEYMLSSAIEIIKQIEQPIIYLSSIDKISRAELENLRQNSILFSTEGTKDSMLTFFDTADYQDEQQQELELNKKNFYPTIFHEGIEITQAYIEYSVYEDSNSFLDSKILYIVEGFNGDKLSGFTRTYEFILENDSNWILRNHFGTINYMGDDYSVTYLPIK